MKIEPNHLQTIKKRDSSWLVSILEYHDKEHTKMYVRAIALQRFSIFKPDLNQTWCVLTTMTCGYLHSFDTAPPIYIFADNFWMVWPKTKTKTAIFHECISVSLQNTMPWRYSKRFDLVVKMYNELSKNANSFWLVLPLVYCIFFNKVMEISWKLYFQTLKYCYYKPFSATARHLHFENMDILCSLQLIPLKFL